MTDAEWIFRQGEARGATKASLLFFVINLMLLVLVLAQGDSVRAYFQGIHQSVFPRQLLCRHGPASVGTDVSGDSLRREAGRDVSPRRQAAPAIRSAQLARGTQLISL